MDVIIVDGYNVINASKKLMRLDLAHARDELFVMLRNYSGFTASKIMLVFDAHKQNTPENIEGTLDTGMLVYTGAGETADMFIERTVRLISPQIDRIRVVTSDNLEQVMIMGYAERMSSRELLAEIERAEQEYEKTYLQKHDTLHTRNMLEGRLGEAMRDSLERMRRGGR